MNGIPIEHILFVSTALFFIGMYGLFTRRNLITMLMAIELILNSVNINFVVFNKYLYPGKLDGIFFTIFIRNRQRERGESPPHSGSPKSGHTAFFSLSPLIWSSS